jgi:hypothetical protein
MDEDPQIVMLRAHVSRLQVQIWLMWVMIGLSLLLGHG